MPTGRRDDLPSDEVELLNLLGQEGWDLIAVTHISFQGGDTTSFWMRRDG